MPSVQVAERLLVASLRAQQCADQSEAARRQLAFLLHASQRLSASLEHGAILEALADLVVPALADGCLITICADGPRRQPQTTRVLAKRLGPRSAEWWDRLERVTRPTRARARRWATALVGPTARTRRSEPALPDGAAVSYLAVPLRARGRTGGTLCVFSLGERQPFGPADAVVGDALGAQAGLALDNARLYAEQREMVQRLEVMRGQLDAAQRDRLRDEERRRIARDLHDHVEQTFFAIELAAEAARAERVGGAPDPSSARSLQRIHGLASTGAEQLRTAIFALTQAELNGHSVLPLLGGLVRGFQQRTGIESDLVFTGCDKPLPTAVAETVYALVREGLTNVERHARASAVVVSLHVGARVVRLTVQDDGVGAAALVLRRIQHSATHFGLRGLAERVHAVDGTFTARSGTHGGFIVRASIPLSAPDAA